MKPYLTVIIRDTAPLEILNEPVEHRSIRIDFTQEQRQKLSLQKTGSRGGRDIVEAISQCFIEYEEVGE